MNGYTITRDGQTVATFDTEGEAWGHLLRRQSQSIRWACLYEGWDIVDPDGVRLSATYGKAGA